MLMRGGLIFVKLSSSWEKRFKNAWRHYNVKWNWNLWAGPEGGALLRILDGLHTAELNAEARNFFLEYMPDKQFYWSEQAPSGHPWSRYNSTYLYGEPFDELLWHARWVTWLIDAPKSIWRLPAWCHPKELNMLTTPAGLCFWQYPPTHTHRCSFVFTVLGVYIQSHKLWAGSFRTWKNDESDVARTKKSIFLRN